MIEVGLQSNWNSSHLIKMFDLNNEFFSLFPIDSGTHQAENMIKDYP